MCSYRCHVTVFLVPFGRILSAPLKLVLNVCQCRMYITRCVAVAQNAFGKSVYIFYNVLPALATSNGRIFFTKDEVIFL